MHGIFSSATAYAQPFPSEGVDINHISDIDQHLYKANAPIRTTENTSVRIWDIDKPSAFDDVLGDEALRKRLDELVRCNSIPHPLLHGLRITSSILHGGEMKTIHEQHHLRSSSCKYIIRHQASTSLTMGLRTMRAVPCFVESHFQLSTRNRKLQIRRETMDAALRVAGLSDKQVDAFVNNTLPCIYTHKHYDDHDGDNPDSISMEAKEQIDIHYRELTRNVGIVIRCPRQSTAILGVMRVCLRTKSCFTFLSCVLPQDTQDVISRCEQSLDSLRIHPLYLLSSIYDHRFQQWTDWFSIVWRRLVEIETATRLTPGIWRSPAWQMEPQDTPIDTGRLLVNLHSTQLEMCHSRTIISYSLEFGRSCIQTLNETEEFRRRLGCQPLSARDRSELEDSFNVTLVRSHSMKNRLDELTDRLSAMINVSFSLISQRDSKISSDIAQIQAGDSRTVTGIAILTLMFLPTTLLATVWSTNLIELDGSRNWQIFLAASVLLTFVVFTAWVLFNVGLKKLESYTSITPRASIQTGADPIP